MISDNNLLLNDDHSIYAYPINIYKLFLWDKTVKTILKSWSKVFLKILSVNLPVFLKSIQFNLRIIFLYKMLKYTLAKYFVLNSILITVNARLMYPWYIRILHIDFDYFYEYTCFRKWNLALNCISLSGLLELL